MEMFREELDSVLMDFTPARVYPVRVRWKRGLAAVVLFAAAACVFWLPSSRAEEAARQEEVNKELRQEAQNVSLVRDTLDDPERVAANTPAGESAVALLESLEGKLARGYDYREAARQVEDTLREIQGLGLTTSDMKGLAGIFAGTGEAGAGAAGLLSSGEAVESLKDISFSGEECRIMLENTRQMLNGGGLTPGQRQVLQKVQSTLEKEGAGGSELARAMAPGLSDAKSAAGLEEAERKLQSMEERLLARAGDSSRVGGDNDLAQGGQAGAEAGLLTCEEQFLSAWDDAGQQLRQEPGALGGGAPGGGGDTSRTGWVEKSAEPVLAPGDGYGTLEVKGKWQEDSGRVTERYGDRVAALPGEDGGYAALYRQFRQEGTTYLNRFAIPPGKKQLVLEYFRGLRGDR